MKILNLYAGIGGNRKLWKNVEVTAVENQEDIAKVYSKYFPNDKIIVGDAILFLMENYKNYDFIWASPSCTTHSKIRYLSSKAGCYEVVLPDLRLYELIIFLENYYDGLWVVENVEPYYQPLIKPKVKIGRHLFWSNFDIPHIEFDGEKHNDIKGKSEKFGFDLTGIKTKHRKDKLIRNCVNPKVAEYILKRAYKED